MKILKFIKLLPSVILIILITTIWSSCLDDNEPTPDYVGKWVTEKPAAVTTGYISVKYYIELTQNNFSETFVRPARTSYLNVNLLRLDGSVSISGNILKLVVHKLSVSDYNSTTGTASEPYETHNYKDQDFGFEFEGTGSSTGNHQAEFSISDGKLILKVDYNRDGIYSETEKSVYIKQ